MTLTTPNIGCAKRWPVRWPGVKARLVFRTLIFIFTRKI